MGWKPCKDHFRKWDLESKDVGDEHWVLVSHCYTCGDPAYWEVYPRPGEDEFLAEQPLRTEVR